MAWGEPANPAAAADLDDDRHYVGPPSIRTTGEIPAVTGELRPRPVQPEVPTFHEAPPPPEPAEPEGPISARTPGGTVVTFPPTAAPGWVSGILPPDSGPEPLPPPMPMPGGPGAGSRPEPVRPETARPRPPGGPPAGPPAPPGAARPPSMARGAPEVETHLSALVGARRSTGPRAGGSASAGASSTGGLADVSPDVFASRTSVLPAARTRRLDLPRRPPPDLVPVIRMGEDDVPTVAIEEDRRLSRLWLGLTVALVVAVVALVAIGSILGLGLR